MRQSAAAVRARWYAVLLIGLCLSVPICLAQAQGKSPRADVAELLKKHDEALNQHSLEGVLALYSASPKTVVLGTGPGEKYQGKAEIKTAYTEIFKDFDKGTLTHSCYWKDGGGSSTMVWLAAMCKFTDAKGEKKRDYELNVSAVTEKQGGKWQFVLMHYSNVVGDTPKP
jgi:ketosteroid isomerase-like protein